MKRSISLFVVLFCSVLMSFSANAQNVNVSGALVGNGTYVNLGAAFTAINGINNQTGANIVIDIVGNTTESATATLNDSSGAASILIRPVGGAWTVSGSIIGAIIKLAGADNVTIDGRIGGTGRNLTVQNTNTAGSTAAIWLSHGAGAANDSLGAQNNTIRNLEILCGANQNTSTNTTIGILVNGATVSTSANGRNNDNNLIAENRIIRVRYGIYIFATNVNQDLNNRVIANIIGPTSFGADQIGKGGIVVWFQDGCGIVGNQVQYVGGTFATTTAGADRIGIGVGSESWSSTPTNSTGLNCTVSGNFISNVIEERTFSAVGIVVSTTTGSTNPSNNLIANNSIINVRANGTAGDAGVGIGHSGRRGDRIVFNSISMTGDIDPAGTTSSASSTAGIRISEAADTAVLVRNNSILVDVNSNTGTLLHSCIQVPSSAYGWGSGGCNNNNYYFTGSQMRLGALGINSAPTVFVTNLAAWQATFTPAQDGASISADPQYANNTSDLTPALASPLKLAGAPISGVLTDILSVIRNATNPTIGAYEITGTIPPDDAGVNLVTRTPAGTVFTNTPVAFTARVRNFGTNAQTSIPVYYRVVGGGTTGPVNTTGTLNQNDTQSVAFTGGNAFTPATPGTYTLKFYTQLTGDTSYSNDTTTISIVVQDSTKDAGVVSVFGTQTGASVICPGTVISWRAVARNLGNVGLASPVDVYYTVNNGTPVGPQTATITNPGDTNSVFFSGASAFTVPSYGTFTLRFYTSLAGDAVPANDTATVTINAQPINAFPYIEKFTSPVNWTVLIENVVGTTQLWGLGIVTNAAGVANDTAARCNFFNGSAGRREILRSPLLDLTSLTNPVLNFYSAYRTFATEDDSIEVLVSTDCGVTFFSATTVYNKSNSSAPSLATLPANTTSFIPSASTQWRHETVSLANVAGLNGVVIGFRGKSAFGNNAWIDNVIVSNGSGICNSTVTGPGAYSCNSLVNLNFTATPLPPQNNGTGDSRIVKGADNVPVVGAFASENRSVTVNSGIQTDNPGGGVATVVQYDNDAAVLGAGVQTNTTATCPGGTIYTPDIVYQDYWFNVTYTGNDKTGYATYDIEIGLDGLVFNYPDSLYIVKRADRLSKWVCVPTTITGNVLKATGLTTFSDFAIAGNSANDPLPVELTSFVSQISGRDVTLNWTTATETNNAGFDIERSAVGGSWAKIGNIAGHGTSTTPHSYSFTDRALATGKYNYRLKQVDFNGNYTYYNLGNEVNIGVPEKFALSQNYPNPFNPSTKINYDLPVDGKVSIKLFDMSGREVTTLVNEAKTAGYHVVSFNASNLSSGVYFYRISVEGNGKNFADTKKMMLVK